MRLFAAAAELVSSATPVLCPGSYVDIAPSVHFDEVTYVDEDVRAARFFQDEGAVRRLIASKRRELGRSGSFAIRFERADYRATLSVADRSVGLLVSLYAGLVSEHCTRYLADGGALLVNNSHGDASLASLDSRYSLAAVVKASGGRYRVAQDGLDGYLVPKRGVPTREELHRSRRGVGYTRSPFGYLFRRAIGDDD